MNGLLIGVWIGAHAQQEVPAELAEYALSAGVKGRNHGVTNNSMSQQGKIAVV